MSSIVTTIGILLSIAKFPLSDGCLPLDYERITENVGFSSPYALGDQTLKSLPMRITGDGDALETKPISETADLFCDQFDDTCRWHNLKGVLVDELDWFRGTEHLDSNRLKISTGTTVLPNGGYGIVATDHVQPPEAKATLVSDTIGCQLGQAELRFRYWTSPEVRLTVCLKRTARSYPNFDFCSGPLQLGDPGPAYVTIPDLDRQPFQIFIQAENFVFQSANLEGGFAIIDSIEYYGDLCNNIQMNDIAFSGGTDGDVDQNFAIGERSLTESSNDDGGGFNSNRSVCDALQCNFDDEAGCALAWYHSVWKVGNRNIQTENRSIIDVNPSQSPFNPTGSFASVVGPSRVARLQTSQFHVPVDLFFVFAYRKASKSAKLRVLVKRADEPFERTLFMTPTLEAQPKRWFREMVSLKSGEYNYLAIDVRHLKSGDVIGVDEFLLLDTDRNPYCAPISA